MAAEGDATPQGALEAPFPSDTYWRSLKYLSLYRLVIAAVFVVAFDLTGGTGNLGSQDPGLFEACGYAYLAMSFAFLSILRRFKQGFDVQVSAQVATDILALTLLMYTSGGSKSGIAAMMVVAIAGAGLVGRGRMTLFYAALATVAVLLEQGFRLLRYSAEGDDFVRTGLLSIGFFATAATAQMLARRVVANEMLARQRGIELANQQRINQQVILDMQDGVLVVGPDGQVCQHNPQAEALLDAHPPAGSDLTAFSPVLAETLRRLSVGGAEFSETIDVAGSGRLLRARILPPAAGGHVLIYLEDLSRIQAQARQIKLAALGRLTANIAHEIRNPLAAISHAAELLGEEKHGDASDRLTRIIGDNAQRLNRLVREVLELGRRDRIQPESIQIDRFLRQLLDEYSLHAPSVTVRVALDAAADAVICFDRAHLQRVVENLLANALRYASEAAGAVRLEAVLAANRCEIHIIDDGPGIDVDARSRIFEPFFTTHSGGTGLGLYIARELCEANGASLELLEAERGTHFRINARGNLCPVGKGGAAAN